MKNSEYWKTRFAQLEAVQNRRGSDAFREIEQIYRQAQKEIEGKINTWYQRLAANNGVSMAEARKMLSRDELKEFKWDVTEYIKHGQENALTGGWMKELENASAKYHISRLEALKIQTRQSLEAMFGKQLSVTGGTMEEVYKSGYCHAAYELQKGFHTGWDIAGPDQSRVEKVLAKPWAADGRNFSERIWNNKQKLISEVHKELSQNVLLGRDPQKAIDAIAKKMNTSKSNAGRLVMTEEAFFGSAAQRDCFKDLDVEQFEVVATLDSVTSEICREMDGKHFPMEQWEVGVTAPPFHVNCRSTTVPYFEDDFGSVGKRAARGSDGKTYDVPADMTYREWEKTFVDGGDKSGLKRNLDMRLDESEKGAIIRYVSPDSIVLNDKLRRGENLTAAEKEWVKNLNNALKKLPCYEGNLNRSIAFKSKADAEEYFNSLVVGGEFIPNQFLSTTKSGTYNEDGQIQIYIKGAKKGRDLGNLSIENEVLYSDADRFIILNKVMEAGKYWILLEEI